MRELLWTTLAFLNGVRYKLRIHVNPSRRHTANWYSTHAHTHSQHIHNIHCVHFSMLQQRFSCSGDGGVLFISALSATNAAFTSQEKLMVGHGADVCARRRPFAQPTYNKHTFVVCVRVAAAVRTRVCAFMLQNYTVVDRILGSNITTTYRISVNPYITHFNKTNYDLLFGFRSCVNRYPSIFIIR